MFNIKFLSFFFDQTNIHKSFIAEKLEFLEAGQFNTNIQVIIGKQTISNRLDVKLLEIEKCKLDFYQFHLSSFHFIFEYSDVLNCIFSLLLNLFYC